MVLTQDTSIEHCMTAHSEHSFASKLIMSQKLTSLLFCSPSATVPPATLDTSSLADNDHSLSMIYPVSTWSMPPNPTWISLFSQTSRFSPKQTNVHWPSIALIFSIWCIIRNLSCPWFHQIPVWDKRVVVKRRLHHGLLASWPPVQETKPLSYVQKRNK